MFEIESEKIDACMSVLNEASKNVSAFKIKSTQFKRVSQWLSDPDEDIIFSFRICLANNGESIDSVFNFDGCSFNIYESQNSYDPGAGGDSFISYEFRQSEDETEESGNIYSWKNQAIEMLDYIDEESPKLRVIISFDDD
jgi:hypothetical protein